MANAAAVVAAKDFVHNKRYTYVRVDRGARVKIEDMCIEIRA